MSEKTNVKRDLSPTCSEDKDSRGSILQPPHPLLLHCGSFKRQISHSEGRRRESTSDRSFVRRCASFGSDFHPSHLNGSIPSVVPRLLEAESECLTAAGGMPTHLRDLPVCLQASPQRHTVFSHFDGCFRNG